MFSTRKSPWGPLNDVTYVIAMILIVPYLYKTQQDLKLLYPTNAFIALFLGITGIFIITITQMRLVLGTIEFNLNLRQGAFGSGLLGVAFIINHLLHLYLTMLLPGLNWLGLISGGLMAMGIPTGLFYGREELEMTTGKLDWKKANKIALATVLSTFMGQIGLIVWVFWYGTMLIGK